MQQTSNCLCCGNPRSSNFSLKGWHTFMEKCFFHSRFTTGANVRSWQGVWKEGEKAGASLVKLVDERAQPNPYATHKNYQKEENRRCLPKLK